MKLGKRVSVIAGLITSLAVAGILTNCGDPKPQAKQSKSMIVVFSTGTNKIIRAESGKSLTASVGAVVNEKDTIQTLDGTVDLQTRAGSAIRVRENTTITVSKLIGGDTQLDMKQGTILANVKRASRKDKFTVTTPTAIAGVRGTTFKVEMADEKTPPKVKVMDGKVAMAPRVKALEKYTKKEIDSNPTLKALAAIEKKEVVLDGKTEGTLDKKLTEKVEKVNKAIEQAKKENKDVTKVAAVTTITKEIAKEQAPAVKKEKVEVTTQELQETGSLVAVDTQTFDKVAAGEKTEAPKQVAALKKLHEQKRVQKQEKVLKRIEQEASKRKFKSEDEIKTFYNKGFEKIVLKNGQTIRGAVIAQNGNVLVIHSSTGVKRVNKSQISQQLFE